MIELKLSLNIVSACARYPYRRFKVPTLKHNFILIEYYEIRVYDLKYTLTGATPGYDFVRGRGTYILVPATL